MYANVFLGNDRPQREKKANPNKIYKIIRTGEKVNQDK